MIIQLAAAYGPARAAEKEFSWADPNFVFCQGIGASGSGRITARVTYDVRNAQVTVTSFSVTGNYTHPRTMTGVITFRGLDGSAARIPLVEPWFVALQAPNVRSLNLPRRSGGDNSPAGQVSFSNAANGTITLQVTNLFSVPGGTCPARFEASFTLP